MALSQLLGGWTKWGVAATLDCGLRHGVHPRGDRFVVGHPGRRARQRWFHNHVMSWTRDIHVSGLVTDFLYYIPVLAFGTGLVFGFSFDTTGPGRA